MAYLFFVLGAVLGSFYLVVGKRLPLNENIVSTRSRCDHCKETLKWWHLIPVLSYLILGGKCYFCKKRISILNLIIELTMGFAFSFAYLYYGIGYSLFAFMILFSIMILIFITDFSYYIILDSPLVIGSFLLFLLQAIYFNWSLVLQNFLSGIIMFLIMYITKMIGDFIFKRESLGGGDIKFAFVMGSSLGLRLGLCSLVLAPFLALPYCFGSLLLKKNNEVPFGPFLVGAVFIIFLFSDKFIDLLEYLSFSL